jgi:hypothetical protein
MIFWALTRDDAGDDPLVDMRSCAEPPWHRLSPDYQHGQIPVTGCAGMYADTCRGVFEGLKLTGRAGFTSHINIGYFKGPGRVRTLRTGEHLNGWMYRGRAVGLEGARLQIEIPTYQWLLNNRVPELVAKLRTLSATQNVWLWDDNQNINLNDAAPLSYAALLCAVLRDDVRSFRNQTFD